MVRIGLFVILILAAAQGVHAQGEDNSLKAVPFKERVFTGGGFGLGFGNVQDFVSVSPVIGYSLTKKLMAGVQVTYRYTNYKVFRPSVTLNDYGVSPFLRYNVYRGFFLQGEYEYLDYEFPTNATNTVRMQFNSVLGGGGLVQPISDKAAFFVMALYNFSHASSQFYTPYQSPFILRAGINIGNFIGL